MLTFVYKVIEQAKMIIDQGSVPVVRPMDALVMQILPIKIYYLYLGMIW